jgi:N utilization substance protein A
MLVTLGEKGVKTLDDLADLAGDELVEILGEEALDEASANEIIMAARAHWFGEDGAGDAQAEAGAAQAADAAAAQAADTDEARDADADAAQDADAGASHAESEDGQEDGGGSNG